MRFFYVLALVTIATVAQEVNDGSKIVSCAKGEVGRWPYSWAGGDNNGATYGAKMTKSPYCDDRKVKGFDCCGLSKYCVFQGTGRSIPHGVGSQYDNCKKLVPVSERKAGDLLFYASGGSFYHVVIYVGNDRMVEATNHDAHCNGRKIHETNVRTSQLVNKACREW